MIRYLALAGAGLLVAGVVALLPPVRQDPAYHAFADGRRLLGIPSALNVLSNVPFLLVGALGLRWLRRSGGAPPAFLLPGERWPFVVFFTGIALTGLGSMYYHAAPTSATLVWDRLPMTVAFMGLTAAVAGERLGPRLGAWLLGPLVLAGGLSVLVWHLGERAGAGDLRPYALVQFGPLVLIPVAIGLFPARYTRTGDLFGAMGWYGLAKLLELGDRAVFAAGHLVSGHTLKHLASAIGACWILRMITVRCPAERAPEPPSAHP